LHTRSNIVVDLPDISSSTSCTLQDDAHMESFAWELPLTPPETITGAQKGLDDAGWFVGLQALHVPSKEERRLQELTLDSGTGQWKGQDKPSRAGQAAAWQDKPQEHGAGRAGQDETSRTGQAQQDRTGRAEQDAEQDRAGRTWQDAEQEKARRAQVSRSGDLDLDLVASFVLKTSQSH
jgi:hypothetical protein